MQRSKVCHITQEVSDEKPIPWCRLSPGRQEGNSESGAHLLGLPEEASERSQAGVQYRSVSHFYLLPVSSTVAFRVSTCCVARCGQALAYSDTI